VARLLDGLGAGDGTDRLLEIGCGVGTLTLPLAARFAGGIGVDAVRSAIDDAHENQRRAGIGEDRLQFRVGWADRAVRRLAAGRARAETVLLHSIRLPYGPPVLDLLPALGARRNVYVSPAPVSLGLDLAHLRATGWTVERVVPVDQIPGTAHIMGVAALRRG
jgi:23S rRNA (uracil1939-C5)-methyltransferase